MHQINSSLIKFGAFRPEAGIPRLRILDVGLQPATFNIDELASAKCYAEIASMLPMEASFDFSWGRLEFDGTNFKLAPVATGDYAVLIPACAPGRTEFVLFEISIGGDTSNAFPNVLCGVSENDQLALRPILGGLVKSGTFSSSSEMPRLRLPNASLRKPAPVVADMSIGKKYDEVAASFPNQSEMKYIWGTVTQQGRQVTIIPVEPGEYVVPIPVCSVSQAGVFFLQLTVNPDPNKLLQREIDPPKDAPYWKPNNAIPIAMEVGNCRGHIIGASRRGQSHALDGTFRDDDYCVEKSGEDVYLIAVADGAGSAKFARRGSELAVKTAIAKMHETIAVNCWDAQSGFSADGAMGTALTNSALEAWNAIRLEAKAVNSAGNLGAVTPHDFNTTLLLAAIKIQQDGGILIASFAIGDGAIAWCDEDRLCLLSQPDGGEYASETYFLTTEKIWRQYNIDRVAMQNERVRLLSVAQADADRGMLLLMTDGVSDPFFPNPIDIKDHHLWQRFIVEEIREAAGIDRNSSSVAEDGEKLLKWINFRKKGHFDDRTLVMFEFAKDSKGDQCQSSASSENGNALKDEARGVSENASTVDSAQSDCENCSADGESQGKSEEVTNA